MIERGEALSVREREGLLVSGDHLIVLGFYYFGADSISAEVVGFSPLWFPQVKILCLFSLVMCLCFIDVLVILSVKRS